MLKNFGFVHAAIFFVLWFGGYMALQYFVTVILGGGVTAAVVGVYFVTTLFLGLRAEKYQK